MTIVGKKTLSEHLESNLDTHQTKRILSLDGGGLKGLITVGMLERLESVLANKTDKPEEFRLSDYFDLIAGTSTGAIIAAALAQGWKVDDVKKTYFDLGEKVFRKRFWQGRFFGIINDKFSDKPLKKALKKAYGDTTPLGSENLKTGLLIVTKRIDSGSTWSLTNNPASTHYEDDATRNRIGTKNYPLWQVVRASTAASTYFKPEKIEIFGGTNISKSVVGVFVDGGLSPYNDPALQSVMVATMQGYGFNWDLSAGKLEVTSMGTGIIDTTVSSSRLASTRAVKALASLMNDTADLQKIILQWMSNTQTPVHIDRILGALEHDLVAGKALLKYLRFDADMTSSGMQAAFPNMSLKLDSDKLECWDDPKNMDPYYQIGVHFGRKQILDDMY